MLPITDEEKNNASDIYKEIIDSNDLEILKALKEKASWEKISLIAVILQWGDPREWE